MDITPQLKKLGLDLKRYEGRDLTVYSPINGESIATLKTDSTTSAEAKIAAASQAFVHWKDVPAPKRGEVIRVFGDILRKHKEPLAQLVTIECGKIIEEGRGEVQEMIDICDFAVGLSRQLYGLTIASERPLHVMQENWLPLGPVGVISAFNFPVAVWAWNATLAIVCGDPVIWKPSEKTPLTALACQHLFALACDQADVDVPEGLMSVILGHADVGEQLVNDPRIPLISATGSCRMGEIVGPKVLSRFGRVLLELGGNNALIVSDKADQELALQSIVFGAVGTAGQRCTTTRRIFIHRSIYDNMVKRITTSYAALHNRIGNPLDGNTLIGPLIDEQAYDQMQAALTQAKKEGGALHFGERQEIKELKDGVYVKPALVAIERQTDIVMEETFAPIAYAMPYDSLEEVMLHHNAVKQGLSSAIFTTDLREAEYFKRESDCGIANVNIGTSGAEIGGAFGGEKATGGGRESGSDSWKNYMRRQTSTTYYGVEKPALAQGISFDAS